MTTHHSPLTSYSKIYVAGHRGLVGSAICRLLKKDGYDNIITATHQQLDLTNQSAVRSFFQSELPEYVFLAAAKVGGINANNIYPAEFIRDNLLIQTNVIDAAYRAGVKKLLFLGSSCIYPKMAPQPLKEESLLTGPLEPTNQWYAIAKIAGIKMCQAYWKEYGFRAISVMPTNLYGPGDSFDLDNSHVVPALIGKFHTAKIAGLDEVEIWGTGQPLREFMHVDDLATACLFLMQRYNSQEIINVGSGEEISIRDLAFMIKEIVGVKVEIRFDIEMPDGTPKKLLDISRITDLGWQAEKKLKDGIEETYAWFLGNQPGRVL